MLRLLLVSTALLTALIQFRRSHLGIANDHGSPNRDQPFEIPNPLLAKAIYGRLEPGKEREYYVFNGSKDQRMNVVLYIPPKLIRKGFGRQLR